MDIQKLPEKNKILKIITGSKLYGTNVADSDTDIVGIFIPPLDYVYGISTIRNIDLSEISKRPDGKNDKHSNDIIFYEFRHFIRLAIENNPNVLECLFVNKDNILEISSLGETLLQHRKLFLHKGLYKRFIGYALSQRKKMIIKPINIKALTIANNELFSYLDEAKKKILLVEVQDKFTWLNRRGNNFFIGDLSFQPGVHLGKVYKIIQNRLSKITNRVGLMKKYGYDTKFASHLLRLLMEGKELLRTGELKFPLHLRNLIIEVKNGVYQMNEILELANLYEKELVDLLKVSKLPPKPQYKKVNDLCINIMKECYLS